MGNPSFDPAWSQRQRPPRLERRLGFPEYTQVRDFLERLERLCEQRQRYPDLSFGRTYVNLTIYPEQDAANVGSAEEDFARAIDGLL
ncbi:MAG: 4a-hydroxytetrahydrobiopterin dehydratase [Synechococcus sp. SB0662_bin_45]|uniref:4a-hydroxytetrahydrobiopterin dehydratase n=1 Tax=Synechococcus sp. SB0676_bin_10 TaxID=2604869 RepID=A0A6B1F209_9SYNE|nr:4a-hydroxytetrahydrobiopterin dehydratase [Cyanobacteria bacterium MAG IRC3_bin_20]MDE0647768.1 4a-hydroxytetrahydrobiopterin dehydratase [Cyanobacteria bacterium MAG IRC4_bin_6]MXW11782.1 4a-hydroxytetrahydrobiopterin dehydratase [Synechococcus sp. SB0668_bin_13]MXX08842.1 4a-hydroxytetrahydrobiopterin dehydratase [Synechococcus sp. SB0667_bin_8]MXY19230.1 4a-hydroxytetrahydrobiopterin dehydratase [Synechococcus sp. SB0664_bin_36]MYE21085.1 4a-hydroxytetrahydrobiopterin dehydratase [Synech